MRYFSRIVDSTILNRAMIFFVLFGKQRSAEGGGGGVRKNPMEKYQYIFGSLLVLVHDEQSLKEMNV